MEQIITTIIIIILALLIPNTISLTKAKLAGRRGVRIYQYFIDTIKLLRKGAVYSPTTTAVFKIAPSVYLGSSIVAMLMIPVGVLHPIFAFNGDVIMFCYLMALGRAALILAAMDTGSSFEGMGASREALYGALIEPALFLTLGTLALISGSTNFSDIFSLIQSDSANMVIVMLIIGYISIKIFTVEMGRIPIDDPKTHLELTMVHEVMILDYCGVDLAFINIGNWLKGASIAMIAANAITTAFALNISLTIAFALLVAIIIGVVESIYARAKMARNATYILTITAIALLMFFVAFTLLKEIEL